MIELLIIFTHLLIDPGKGRWPLCVWWPWLQEAQRACGSYGKRRVCQRATACLQEEAATGVLSQCQIPFPAWENAFSESPIMTPQSYPELWGTDHSGRTLGAKPGEGYELFIWFNGWKKRMGSFSFPTQMTHHSVDLILPASVESSLFAGLAQWQGYSLPVTKALRSKGLGRQTSARSETGIWQCCI